MKCPKCDGTGQLPDPNNFQIPLWLSCMKGSRPQVSFVGIDKAGDSAQVHEIGQEFGKFIKGHGHGCFHDGLKAELNRD